MTFYGSLHRFLCFSLFHFIHNFKFLNRNISAAQTKQKICPKDVALTWTENNIRSSYTLETTQLVYGLCTSEGKEYTYYILYTRRNKRKIKYIAALMVSIFLFYVTSCENVALFQRIYVALFMFCCIIFYDHQKLQFPNREIDGNCRRPNELPRLKTNYN